MNSIVKLPDINTVVPITDNLDGWTIRGGNPKMKTWILNTSNDGSMISGYWEATPGTYYAVYSEYEFVHILEGEVVITPDGCDSVSLVAGDTFVVEADFKGTWEIIQTVRKYFDIRLK